MPERQIRLAKIPRLFYIFRAKSTGLIESDLSHRGSLACGCQIRQIPVGLFDRSQAVSDQESLIDQKPEIIRLQGHTPCRLPVEKGYQLYGGRSPGPQVAHQELAGHAGVDQALHQQNMPSSNLRFVAEEDLHDIGSAGLRLGVLRL